MNDYLVTIAYTIEFVGSIIIAIACLRAVFSLLKDNSLEITKTYIATGVVTALDFKLAATLLKILTLMDWNQIGMFASIYAMRFILKKNFSIEERQTVK